MHVPAKILQVFVHYLYNLMPNETRTPETNEAMKFFLNQSSDDIISEVAGESDDRTITKAAKNCYLPILLSFQGKTILTRHDKRKKTSNYRASLLVGHPSMKT